MSTNEESAKFADDWNAMIAAVSTFSDKYDLPKGELIFPPRVLSVLRYHSRERLLATLINRGVRVRFGKFEQSEVFRSL